MPFASARRLVALAATVSAVVVGAASAQTASGSPVAPAAVAPAAGATCTSSAIPTTAKLRVEVTSTAPQVDVHLQPTQVTGRKDTSLTGGAKTAFVPDGVRVTVPSGAQGVVNTEIAAADPTGASQLTLRVDKVGPGTVTVRVWSSSGYGEPAVVTTSGSSAQVTVPRTSLFDPSYSLPKADSRKLVLAAYYPWFTANGWEDRPTAERPANPRSVWSPAGVLSMTQQARDHGVDGFVVSWMGAAKNGEAYDLAASAAVQTNGVVAPYLEVAEGLNHGGVATVEQWLKEAVARTGPASLRVDGTPVVFVWDMAKVPAAQWTAMLGRLGQPVKLIGDADTGTHGAAMKGWHAYLPTPDLTGEAERGFFRSAWFRGQAAVDPSLTPRINVATVSPGFNDRALRGADRPVVKRAGGRYSATWDAAVAAEPDMVLITSWNEWFEGTEIEPGTIAGDAALLMTAQRSAAWKAQGSCTGS